MSSRSLAPYCSGSASLRVFPAVGLVGRSCRETISEGQFRGTLRLSVRIEGIAAVQRAYGFHGTWTERYRW
jgi:hypothetical protein